MSDSRRRYCAVKDKLRQLAPDLWMECESCMTNLSLMVSAIVKAKDLTQHAMAAKMPVSAQDTSLAQRQRRWLMNEHVDEWVWYRAIIGPFLQAVSSASVPLILDTTAAGIGCHVLTVAVGYHQRALPITWRAGQGSRGHTDALTHIGLLERVATQLALDADVIVLGDGEFGTVALLTWDEAHHRLLPLVTGLSLPQEVRYWYAKRYRVEPLFGDIKGHGFDLQTCRLRHPERIARLMLAVALAYLWLCSLSVMAIFTGSAKLVDRTDRRDRSLFTIGRQWLNRLLKLDRPIPVSFCPYPFLRQIPAAGVG